MLRTIELKQPRAIMRIADASIIYGFLGMLTCRLYDSATAGPLMFAAGRNGFSSLLMSRQIYTIGKSHGEDTCVPTRTRLMFLPTTNGG